MISREDAESNRRLVEALFGSVADAEELMSKDKSIPSHQQLDYEEDGTPTLLRFVYVDEPECIGCTYCVSLLRKRADAQLLNDGLMTWRLCFGATG